MLLLDVDRPARLERHQRLFGEGDADGKLENVGVGTEDAHRNGLGVAQVGVRTRHLDLIDGHADAGAGGFADVSHRHLTDLVFAGRDGIGELPPLEVDRGQ